jgi:hypothetical protein
MIIIGHGSILTPSSNNWAAIFGCNGRDPPAYIQFLRTLLLLPWLNAEKKVTKILCKDESSAILKQKPQSHREYPLSYGGFKAVLNNKKYTCNIPV